MPGLRPRGSGVGGRHSKAVTQARAEIESWLAAAVASPPDSIQAMTGQTVSMASDAVANAIVNALHSNGYYWSDEDHVLCAFLAAAAQAMQQLQDRLEHAVSQIVTAVLATPRQQQRSIPAMLARIAAQAAVDELMRLAAVQHFDNLLRAIRILAVTRCPDPLHHRAVAQYCLSPLGKEVLSDATRQELLSSLPRGWTTTRAPGPN